MAIRITKLIVIAAILYVLSFLPGVSVTWMAILVSTIILGFSGFMGDRMLMPKMSNLVASLTDAGMAFAIVWIVMGIAPKSTITFLYLLLVAVAYAIFEYVFHQWVYAREKYERGQS